MLWTKKNFIVDCLCLNGAFVPEIRGGLLFCYFFVCGKHVHKLFIDFPQIVRLRIRY